MDFDKILALIREMNRENVEYITFGAVALNLHGIVRATTHADGCASLNEKFHFEGS